MGTLTRKSIHVCVGHEFCYESVVLFVEQFRPKNLTLFLTEGSQPASLLTHTTPCIAYLKDFILEHLSSYRDTLVLTL